MPYERIHNKKILKNNNLNFQDFLLYQRKEGKKKNFKQFFRK
jgi:hypothetical protein